MSKRRVNFFTSAPARDPDLLGKARGNSQCWIAYEADELLFGGITLFVSDEEDGTIVSPNIVPPIFIEKCVSGGATDTVIWPWNRLKYPDQAARAHLVAAALVERNP